MSTVLPRAAQCAFLGLSHSPLLGLSTLPEPVDRRLRDALARTAAAVREWSPDLIVLVAPDHYNNFFHELMPPFCLGTEAEAIGDYGTPAGPLRVAEAEALALGEFLAARHFLRATVPLVAGVVEMPYWRFQFANFTSAFVWSGVLMAPGLFGVKMMM